MSSEVEERKKCINIASYFSIEKKLEKRLPKKETVKSIDRQAEKSSPIINMIAVQKLEVIKGRNLFKQLSLLTPKFQ